MSKLSSLDEKKALNVYGYMPIVGFSAKFEPLDIDEVLFMGASITQGVADGYESVIEQEFARKGLPLTVSTFAVGGRTVRATYDAWELAKSAWTGKKVLVTIHTLGNDVSDTRPYSTLTQGEIDSINQDIADLIASVYANGNTPLLVNTTFRNYDGTTINNEDAGSKPYNDAMIYPASESLNPPMFGDTPYIDPYNLTRNLNTLIQQGDGIHYLPIGYGILRRFWVDNIYNRITGAQPIQIVRIPDPSNPVATPKKVLLVMDAIESTTDSPLIYGAQNLNLYQTDVVDEVLCTLEGYEAGSLTMTYHEANVTKGKNNGALNTGDTTQTLHNDHIKETYIYTQSASYVDMITIKGFNPNQSAIVKIAAFRDTTATTRVAEYSLDGGATSHKLDGSTISASNIAEIPFTANGQGEVTIQFRVEDGSSYAYFNGLEVIV